MVAKIVPVLKKQDVVKAAIFGSVARGQNNKNSDIDILIKYHDNSHKSLLDLVHLQSLLEDEIGKKVDLTTYNSIHPLLKKTILEEQKVIYER